jgi:probable F420-dependent oxidoreductase
MPKIKFGLFLPTGDFAAAKRAAERAEADGFYSVSINDHFFTPFGPPQTPQIECFTTLTAIAATTARVRLGPSVAAASFRHPPMLAKIASTLDHVSGGRLILGLGAGWMREEYDAHGYPYPSNVERLAQLAETIAVLKAMWTENEPTYRGRYFTVDKAYNHPRPMQKPHPPIMIGGAGSKLLEVAAAEADIVNFIPPIFHGRDAIGDPSAAVRFDRADLKRRIRMLQRFATRAGRDPRGIETSGLVLLNMSKEKKQADAAVRDTASRMGFSDDEAVRRAPVLLMGTPDEVRRELSSRVEEFGIAYYIVFPVSEESYELLVREVIPAFAS